MSKGKEIIGVAWYSRQDWVRLRAVASDRTKLDDSYEEWLAGAEKALRGLAKAGADPRRVNVDVEALVEWCQAEGRPVDSAARATYVANQLRRIDQ